MIIPGSFQPNFKQYFKKRKFFNSINFSNLPAPSHLKINIFLQSFHRQCAGAGGQTAGGGHHFRLFSRNLNTSTGQIMKPLRRVGFEAQAEPIRRVGLVSLAPPCGALGTPNLHHICIKSIIYVPNLSYMYQIYIIYIKIFYTATGALGTPNLSNIH